MKCPICRKELPPQSPSAPFCSERCKLVDLGNWASGKYVISTPLKPGEEEATGEPNGEDPDAQP